MPDTAQERPIPTEEQIDRANAAGRTPVVFIHGLWLLPSSWDRWAAVFEDAGYVAVTPGWPDDPETVEEANANPEVFAHKTVGQVADHYSAVIEKLDKKPAILGHSFGGLLVQIVAGRGLSAATVAIDAAPFRGVLPLPVSALRAAAPVLGNPLNHHRAVPLTYDQFRFAFANAVEEDEAQQLYKEFAVPASGTPLFQAATANLNPWTQAKPTTRTPTAGRCSSSPARRTTPHPQRSPTPSTKSRARTPASPKRSPCPTADTAWSSTTAGARSATSPSTSSSAGSRNTRPHPTRLSSS